MMRACVCVCLLFIFKSSAQPPEEQLENLLRKGELHRIPTNNPNFAIFEKLFAFKRNEQKDAVQRILGMKTQEKQSNLLRLIISKMMEVLSDSRSKLESSGYLPGTEEFPENELIRDSLSSILENTAFLGDLILYLPDATKPFLKNNEWDTIFKWSLSFCREITFLDRASKKLFSLVAQELNLIDRDPNYTNPYAKVNQINTMMFQDDPPKKKERVKKPRGPSLSRTKTEL